ncbi:MAG TPA: HAD family hydrolase [Nakamurella multipartita]|jgi:Cof subfamily protein (haloacid dehalogenase superfamily)|nr:HAD family hydrolase [Nakamurella multipartita]
MHRIDLDLSATTAVVLDVDGTIAGSDHRISARTSAAMRALDEAGVPVVLATGRTRSQVLDIARDAGLRSPQISCNGGLITDPLTAQDLWVRPVPDADMTAMVELHHVTGQPLTWWTIDQVFATSQPLARAMEEINEATVVLATPEDIEPGTVLKTMIFGTRQELDDAAPAVGRLVPRAMRSMNEFWELSAPDASKWSAIEYVFDRLGVDPARAAGAGDGGNDAIWLARIGAPVAMGNARPEARAVAAAVIGRHDEDGAAEFLEEVLRQVGTRVG